MAAQAVPGPTEIDATAQRDALVALAAQLAAEPARALQSVVDATLALACADAVALALPDPSDADTLRWCALAGARCAALGLATGGATRDTLSIGADPGASTLGGTAAFALPLRAGGVLCVAGGTPVDGAALAAFAELAVRLDAAEAASGALEALRHSEQRFEKFMEQLPGLAWIKDLAGRYVFVNDAAERAFRHARAELYGRTDDEIFSPDTAAQFRANDLKVVATGIPVQTIEMLEQSDGMHHSLVHKFAVPGPDGAPHFIGGVAIDISERIRVEQALRDADHHKDQFLATLAHELRNPLAPIRSGLQALALAGVGAGDARQRQVREIMERQVEHMVRLIDELTEVSRITRGKIELRREPVDVLEVVRAAVDASQPAIDAARHRLTVDVLDGGLVVDADPVRLTQILVNLLNNAAKYTEAGGSIALCVRAAHGSAQFSVRDDGVGIPREMLPRVFDLFTQVDRSLGRAQGGLGIGLALVKRLVEMHGGSVEALSAGAGQGSEFRVRLPLADEAAARAAHDASAAPRPLPRSRVLVVDDNRDAALCLQNLVQLLGMDARAAFDGPSALQDVLAMRPAFVLLDLEMPGMSGYDVAARVRELPGGADIVLVAVTGLGQPEDRRRTRAAGFSHHLVKPADVHSLQAALTRAEAAALAADPA